MAALLALAIAVGAAGCGEEEGVEDGATVTAYMEKPLCQRSESATVPTDGGSIALEFVCLPAARGPELGQGVGGGRQVDLATAGANARRATEDSTTVAYVGEPGTAARFSRPILEAAGIAFVPSSSEDRAIQQILDAVSRADPGSLRADVREILDLQ